MFRWNSRYTWIKTEDLNVSHSEKVEGAVKNGSLENVLNVCATLISYTDCAVG